ncbi:MAG: M48 family metalloprotease [Acidobacteriota bacterium]|nr:M48 family metalloprotease [Acidobacteriota bacterium]
MRKLAIIVFVISICIATVQAQLKTLKPGWNLFSPQQDVQLGKEAAAQVEQKMTVIRNPELDGYLNNILNRLKQSPHAGNFPYTIHAVADKNINAFSLPGGPLFVNTGLIQNADNEAQMAGVIAHEMSHVALRHSTNQISKRNGVSIAAMLVGAVAGNGLLGQLTQLGAGVGANSLLLKFSRTDESQADYNGAEIMADAGYNPIEMANFFEKLEKQGGPRGTVSQLLSDHPNPGNRVAAVQDEIRQMPQRSFNTNTGEFPRIKDMVSHLPAQGRLVGSYEDGHQPAAPPARPSGRLREYRGNSFSFSYPDNWQVFGDDKSNMVTVAPQEGLVRGANNAVSVGYGLEASYYFPEGNTLDLAADTRRLIAQLQQQNPGMRVERNSREIQVGGQRGLLTTLNGRSPYQGETEVDSVASVPRPDGLFYMVFIAPQSEASQLDQLFNQVLASVRFN